MRSLPSFFKWSLNLSRETYLPCSNNSLGRLAFFAQNGGDCFEYSRLGGGGGGGGAIIRGMTINGFDLRLLSLALLNFRLLLVE